MKTSILISLTFAFVTARAQNADTIQVQQIDLRIHEIIPLDNCAHGHSCCAVGCSCCGELKREQKFDAFSLKTKDGITVQVVHERYGLANRHDIAPVHFLFDNGEQDSQKWYSARFLQHSHSFVGYEFDITSSDLKKLKLFENGTELVFNADFEFKLMDAYGAEQPISFHGKERIQDDLYRSVILVGRARIYALTNEQGEQLSKLKYSKIGPLQNGQMVVHRYLGRVGLLDENGSELIPAEFNDIDYLGDQLYACENANGKTALFRNEAQLSPFDFRNLFEFSEGMAFAELTSGKKGFINSKGAMQFYLPDSDKWAFPFRSGLSAVYNGKKWGFINLQGELVIDFPYDKVRSFQDGVAPVALGSNSNTDQWGLIDVKGKRVTPFDYDEISEFKGGLARCAIRGKGVGLINTKGRLEMKPYFGMDGYGSENSWFINGLMIRTANKTNEGLELIDEKGRQVLDLNDYLDANFIRKGQGFEYYDDLIIVINRAGRRGLMNLKGELLMKCAYDYIELIDQNTVRFLIDKQSVIFDFRENKTLWKQSGGNLRSCKEGIIELEFPNYQFQYFNLYGTTILPY